MAENGLELEYEKSNDLDTLIELLPSEMNLPLMKEFSGFGNNSTTVLEKGNQGVSKLDKACQAYEKSTNRRQADQELTDLAFSRLFAGDSEPDEKTAALITACCMVSKITFEKCFNRITRVLRKNKNKKKKAATRKVKIAKK